MIGKVINGVEVLPMSEVEQHVQVNGVNIAALTLPKEQASRTASQLADFGVQAFWNFASTDLNLPEDVVVENVHLAESLMRLSYK